MNYNIEKISKDKINQQYDYMKLIKVIHADKNPTAFIQTFGCQQNEADSEILAGMLDEMGYSLTPQSDDADLILVNTCAVREHAELKALSITGQFKHLKAANPYLTIGVCGCMVSQEHRKDDIKHKYPYVDFLFGTEMLYSFPEILYNTLTSPKRQLLYSDSDGNIAEGLPIKRYSAFKAWVSIMYGCNNFCTYCVVPYVRGRERSREKDDILNEIKQLITSGYKEITLLGQNVNSYGCDLEYPYDFSDLLNEICAINGDFLVKFMTSHPKDANNKLIDIMAVNDKIAKQLHLPVQSGNNRVLKAMNRGYTAESYLKLIKYAKDKMPNIALSTDIIVGFPGETDEEFEDTLAILKEVRFDSIYTFIYSKRTGTKAAEMVNQIPHDDKTRRFEKMLKLQSSISYEKNKEYENTVQKVLVENISKNDESKLTGRNEKNRIVHFEGSKSLIGKWVNIKITKTETYAIFGELIN